MNKNRIYIKAILILSMLYLSGCASSLIKAYPEKLLPLSEVGTVTCDSAIQVTAVDGNRDYRLYSGGGLYYQDCIISLKPGLHTITFRYYFSSSVSTVQTNEVTHKVNIEKGKIYRIKYEKDRYKWKPWIEELKGDELEKQRKDLLIRIKNLDV